MDKAIATRLYREGKLSKLEAFREGVELDVIEMKDTKFEYVPEVVAAHENGSLGSSIQFPHARKVSKSQMTYLVRQGSIPLSALPNIVKSYTHLTIGDYAAYLQAIPNNKDRCEAMEILAGLGVSLYRLDVVRRQAQSRASHKEEQTGYSNRIQAVESKPMTEGEKAAQEGQASIKARQDAFKAKMKGGGKVVDMSKLDPETKAALLKAMGIEGNGKGKKIVIK